MTQLEVETMSVAKMACRKYLNTPTEKEIDWEQRRYEIAKAVLPEIIRQDFVIADENQLGEEVFLGPAEDALNYADALINLLKGGEQ